MEYRPYMNTARQISRLGFGGWTLGNTAHGRTMSIEEGVTLVKSAFEKGVTFFDTAPNYAEGRSETIIGKALRGYREKVIINTKFGHHADGTIDFAESQVRPSVESSLKRLQTDYLDSVILHNPDKDLLAGKTKHFEILEALKNEGTILGYGVSVDTPEELDLVFENLHVDVVEILFNIFSQQNRVQFDTLKKRGISVIVKVPLDSGWLSGKYNRNSTFTDIRSRWSEADLNRRHTLVEQLRETIGEGEPLIPYAIGFVLSYDAVSTVIPGIRNHDQLNDHLKSAETRLDAQIKKALETFFEEKIADTPLPW